MRIRIIPVILLSFVLASCGGEKASEEKSSEGENNKKSDKVRVYIGTKGTESLPFYSWPKELETPIGIEPRLLEYILDQAELDYEFITDYEFDGEGDPRLEAITSGKADISMRGITINEDRAKEVLFSEVYHTDGAGIMVMQSSDYFELKDLLGKKIYALRFSTSYTWAEKNLRGVELVTAEEFGTETEPIEMLRSGKVDAYLADYGKLRKVQKEMAMDTRLFMKKFSSEEYGIAISKNRPDLKEKIDRVLKEMKVSGRLADFTAGFSN